MKYHDQQAIKNQTKLKELTSTLPPFCTIFFRGIQEYTSTQTRTSYAYDIKIFFEYLHNNIDNFRDKDITDYDISMLDLVTRLDIEQYLDYCSYYTKDGKEYVNTERGKARKLASLRSFYNYFFANELITKNPAVAVTMPKLHEKEIIRLDQSEVASLLDYVDSADNLSTKQKDYYNKTKSRDICITTLLLGTGMRVSELVGIDMNDIDFKNSAIKIKRKGGSESVVYYGKEVESTLIDYLADRQKILPVAGHENALFLSLQKKRITVRSVELLIKKYSSHITTLKKITPHKLRSTFGTALYRQTGDIYLVADVLGHKDINTTRKHYAAIEEDQRKKAANTIKLR